MPARSVKTPLEPSSEPLTQCATGRTTAFNGSNSSMPPLPSSTLSR